jgi:phosphoserine phosphatase RsbU/P
MDIRKRGLSFKLALFILTSTTCIFFAAFTYSYYSTKRIVLKNVEEEARNLTMATINRIETVLHGVEKVPTYIAYRLETSDHSRDEVLRLARDMVVTNPEIFGSTIAYEPHAFDEKDLYFAPYFCRSEHELKLNYLGSDSYRYFYRDWYQIPKELDRAVWSDPYFDEGAGNIVMSTYSVPFYRNVEGERRLTGIVTADISLQWFVELVSKVSLYKSGYAFLVSGNGVFVSHPNKEWIMRESVFSIAEATGDANLRRIGRCMVTGGEGFSRQYSYHEGKASWIYYAPLPSVGWSMGFMFPEDELFGDMRRLHREVLIIGGSGFVILFLIIVLISRTITRPLRALSEKAREIAKGNLDTPIPETGSGDEVGLLSRSFESMKIALKEYMANLAATTAAKERIESELKIAHTIQMSFLPKRFPPFPEKQEFDIFATLEPAREVGGDLYDFFLQDNDHLFVCIGDVSGKGVPAALFMAVTKTLMKGIAEHGVLPSDVLARVNRELCEENESSMFITAFCGVLNFRTGEFLFSNGGHNPPVIVRSGGGSGGPVPRGAPEWLNVPKGLLLGVFPEARYETERIILREGETLLLYTDGVTEAMNVDKSFYTDMRLLDVVGASTGRAPQDLVEDVVASVKAFSGGEAQADDITLLALRFKGKWSG